MSPNHSYRVNSETLLLLAWCSTLDLCALLQRDQQACPWKYPCQDGFPEDLLYTLIDEAIGCLPGDVYGPVLQLLVLYRLAQVDMQHVARAIALHELSGPSCALFFADDRCQSSRVRHQEKQMPLNETEAFWLASIRHVSLYEHLVQQSLQWQGNVCLGAHYLHIFFSQYSRMLVHHTNMPFFIAEWLSISLQHVDWHAIAARILGIAVTPCACVSQPVNASEVHSQLFQELLTLINGEIRQASRLLPDHLRANALFLSGLCADMASFCCRSDIG
jgi:hypothetical protein